MKILKLIGSIAICFLAGAIGSIFTFSAIPTWYALINKPAFNPPNWLFGPAWTTLYILMGIALFLVWQAKAKNKQTAYTVFFIQLALNALWSILFFGAHDLFLSFIEIIILWIMILWSIIAFYRISKPAGYLLIPYLCWVTFASTLTFAVWQLN